MMHTKFSDWYVKRNKLDEAKSANREMYDKIMQKNTTGYPPIDRNEYTELPGLEGPFDFRNIIGKILYYDPKEGKYYDRKTDMYLTDDEQAMLNAGR